MANKGPRGADPRPLSDRPIFKPFAVILLVPVVLIAALVMSLVIAPPFVGLAMGVKRIDAKLTALGADFTKIPRFPQRSTIYANDGKTVLDTVFLDNREDVKLKDISKVARNAVLAIEDSGFYTHGALNWSSLMRALVANARAGAVVQGGSTITQQLVKNTLGVGTDQSFERKFQELALAIRVEQKYTKDQILELYLNEIYMGNGVYGLGTASEFYFDKPASELTLTEGATLAGMIRAPSHYDPLAHPVNTRVRRNDVLNRMMGQGTLDRVKGERAKRAPLGIPKGVHQIKQKAPPYFVTYTIQQILANPNGEFSVLGKSEAARRRALFEGGLRIYTTLDPTWQAYAQAAANQPYAVGLYTPPGSLRPDTAIVSLDTYSGAVRTMLSGRDYPHDQLDLVNTPHQPGSSFKPYILATAFEQGIPPTQTYSSKSPYFPPGGWPGSSCNCVTNAEGPGDSGFIDLYRATTDSVNVVFAQLIQDVGAENVVAMAHRMGITTDIPAVDALATGSVGITPLEQASGYQTLANGGDHCTPYTVERIADDKGNIYTHQLDCNQVIKPDIANLITSMLRSVVTSGTGTAANLYPWLVAGKTGTANNNTNVWFSGYTRQVVTAVWVGSPGDQYSMGSVFGGTVCAPIWNSYMSRVMSGQPALPFPSAPTPPQGPVPNVVGMNKPGATQTLGSAGFRVTLNVVNSGAPKGQVVGQSPSAGATVSLGTAVTINVSDGNGPVTKVPTVTGARLDSAKAILTKDGYVVKVTYRVITDPQQQGVVLAQSPDGGTSAPSGTTVTLTVGRTG
jgi:membrane peptidoglycan carboxypeptidase